MLVGTSDEDRSFYPFALAVCKSESAADFEFIFDCLHTYDWEWKPRILLAEGAEAITAGFCAIFGMPEVRVMCLYHAIANVE